MRPDMAKIIVERPRPPVWEPHGRDGRRFRNSSDAAFLPMKAGYRDRKSLNENLQPLARYLMRQAGRPWDAVYRDVRAVIDGRNTVQQHILQHLPDFVAIHTRVVDGRLIDVGAQMFGLQRVWQPLFVHPRTGLLLRNRDRALWRAELREDACRAQRVRAALWREVSTTIQLHRLDGLWFEVTIENLPAAPATRWDAVRRMWVAQAARDSRYSSEDRETEKIYGRPSVYAISKRQLAAREIRSFGLRGLDP